MGRKKSDKYSVNTDGGAFIGGSVNTGGGDFIGRDKINDDYNDTTAPRESRRRPGGGGSGRRQQVRIDDLQVQWDMLGEKLKLLEEEHSLETRADEKLRLKHKIDEIWAERDRIEQELDRLESRG